MSDKNLTLDSVWKSNDPRDERYVRVHKLSENVVYIVRINADGSSWPKSRLTNTFADNFGKKARSGFTFVRSAP